MTTLEAIQKIKQMFVEVGELPDYKDEKAKPSEKPLEAAKEYSLKSGLKVSIDSLAVGGKVSVVDEGGNESPAPAGEHELIDGTKIVLDDKATIVSVDVPKAEVAEDLAEDKKEDEPKEEDMMKKKIEEMQKQLDDLKMSYDEKMGKQEAKFSKAIADITDVMIQLINTPSADATEAPKDKFNQHVERKEDKMKRFLEFAKSIK